MEGGIDNGRRVVGRDVYVCECVYYVFMYVFIYIIHRERA